MAFDNPGPRKSLEGRDINELCLNVKDNRKEEKFEDAKGVIRSCKSKVRRSK
jgi:hypothetical protein